jgi:putative ABC transport system permease protein
LVPIMPMFKNFLIIAIRTISKHKGFSFINIAGLALGLSACLLIGFFVWDEMQYDQFLPEGNRVFRIYNEYSNNEGTSELAVSPPVFSSTLEQNFPEVEKTTRVLMQPPVKTLFEAGKIRLYEENGFYADSGFFDVFPLSFTHTPLGRPLDDPASIVISQDMAERFFGKEDPIGKTILMDKEVLQVKAVFQKNSRFHLPFNFLRPMIAANIPNDRMNSWGWQQFYNYVKVKKGTDPSLLESKFQQIVRLKSQAFTRGKDISYVPFFQPLQDIHLHSSSFKFDTGERGNINYVNALIIIAVFILVIACFNFVNLATAKSLQRAKEVGVRKTIGAGRTQLMVQFIGETLLLAAISMVIAIVLTILFIPRLNLFTNKQLSPGLFLNPMVMLSILLLTLLVGIVAGLYPALVLSGFKPIHVLKASASHSEQPGKIPWLRNGLVVIQFSLSVLLIISAIVVFKQVEYLHQKDLGFNKEEIMFFPMRGDNLFKNYASFKSDLQRVPGVISVSIGYGFPGDAVAGDEIIVPRNGETKKLSSTQLMVDFDYIKTLGLQLVAGRDFSLEMKTDKDHAFIINETAAKELGFGSPENALGQKLEWAVWDSKTSDSLKIGEIIGVVRDFHYKSLYDKVETAILQIYPYAYSKVAIKLKTAEVGRSIQSVKQVWDRFAPGYPIEYKFLDDNFEKMYTSEDKLRTLLWIFTAIAIFIGCLGLFGLATYSAERRKKEVGIRKVLGASIQQMVFLLSGHFIKLVLISLVIATPVAWFFMSRWLHDFAYRIRMDWWMVAMAGIAALTIAFFTVGFQAFKASMANPVDSLRSE